MGCGTGEDAEERISCEICSMTFKTKNQSIAHFISFLHSERFLAYEQSGGAGNAITEVAAEDVEIIDDTATEYVASTGNEYVAGSENEYAAGNGNEYVAS